MQIEEVYFQLLSIIYSNKITFWICFIWAFIAWFWILGHFNCEKQMKIHHITWIQHVVKCFFLLNLSKDYKIHCCIALILPAPVPHSQSCLREDDMLFCTGSWSALHGAVTTETGRGMFTSVPFLNPETAATSSISKVRFGMSVFNLWPLWHEHWPLLA